MLTSDLRAMPSAGQPPAVRRQRPATDRNRYSTQPHMNRERACPPMSQVRYAAVIGWLRRAVLGPAPLVLRWPSHLAEGQYCHE
jgi:hypothetical protein